MADVKVSLEAAKELEEAAVWYEQESTGLGSRLLNAFESAVNLLKEPFPPLTPVSGSAAKLGASKLILHRFPFSVITIKRSEVFVIVALAHHSRKPGYWRSRLDQ